MADLKTKEHLLFFMQCGLMSLSTHDLKFIRNLQSIIISQNKITTNQAALFEKLVSKYQRQLLKQKFTKQFLSELKWEATLVPSDPKFTDAFIYIENDLINFKSPFNKKFIKSLAGITHHRFKWIKEKKIYQAPFSTVALKTIVDLSNEHYEEVNYCPIIKDLLNTLIDNYSAVKFWSPTLVKVNGNYIVSAINENLFEATKHIVLSDDPECISTLVTYGISIDESVIRGNRILEFASSFAPEIDINIEDLVEYLIAIKCDCVVFAGNNYVLMNAGKTGEHFKNVLSKLKDNNIENIKFNREISNETSGFKRPVLINFMYSNLIYLPVAQFHKIIRIKNSTPVNVIK